MFRNTMVDTQQDNGLGGWGLDFLGRGVKRANPTLTSGLLETEIRDFRRAGGTRHANVDFEVEKKR